MKRPKPWLPLWVDPWLFGSTRHELTHGQRGIWIDFLALAAKDDGFIRANDETPYPAEQLAGLLCLQVEVLSEAQEAFIRTGKLTRLENGTLYITKWKEYQLTPRHVRRLARPSSSPLDSSSSSKEKEKEKERRVKKRNADILSGKADNMSASDPPPPSINLHLIPEIPKGLPFLIQDELKRLRAEIRRAAREEEKKNRGEVCSEFSILAGSKAARKYLDLLEDYK